MNRQGLQNAVRAAFVANFNDTFQAECADSKYRNLATAVPIDFDGGGNFVEMAVDVQNIELTPFFDDSGAWLAISTGSANDDGRPHGIPFVGQIDAHIYGIINRRDGAETSTADIQLNAFEAAAWKALNKYTAWPIAEGISFNRVTRGTRGDLKPLKEGFRQWFELVASFRVVVTTL